MQPHQHPNWVLALLHTIRALIYATSCTLPSSQSFHLYRSMYISSYMEALRHSEYLLDWYDIKAPLIFDVQSVGKTLVNCSQGLSKHQRHHLSARLTRQ